MNIPVPERLKGLWSQEKQRANLLLALGAVGILLLGLSELWLQTKPEPDTGPPPTAQQDGTQSDYAQELEQRLQTLLCQVAGAGRVEVMVTLASGEETVYAKDRQYTADGAGQEQHVLQNGSGPALVETVALPAVQGVAVLCEGGESAAVQSRITQIVDVLTGVGTSHITVARLATTNEGGEP